MAPRQEIRQFVDDSLRHGMPLSREMSRFELAKVNAHDYNMAVFLGTALKCIMRDWTTEVSSGTR